MLQRGSLECCWPAATTAMRTSSCTARPALHRTAPHPACEHVPPYRNPSTVVCKSEPPRPSSIHPPTDARTHTLQASLACLCLSTCLPTHPGDECEIVSVSRYGVCKPASQPVPQRQNLLHPWRRLFALCRSARSRPSPRLNVHCSPLTTASGDSSRSRAKPSPPPLDPQVL